MTGEFFSEMSDASGTLWLNVEKRSWSERLLNLTELSIDQMPSLVEGSESTSNVDKKFSNKIGFDKEVVIAGGAGDQAAGATGSGVVNPNQSVISLGTSGVYFSPTLNFVSNTNEAVHSFCHCLPNTWCQMSVMLSATNCLNWISKIFNLSIKDCMKKIENFSNKNFNNISTPYFLPYLSGERTPHNNPYLRGSFHMLNTSTDVDSLIYSVIEGISFGIKDGYEAVHYVSKKSDIIYLVGGGSKNLFWAKLLASLLNHPVAIGEDANLGPALGVARLAMLSTGEYSQKDVIKSMKIIKECSIDTYLSERLHKRYKIWKEIVNSNVPIAESLMRN